MTTTVIDRAIQSVERKAVTAAAEREIVGRIVDMRLDGELRIRAPWLSKAERAALVETTR